MIFSRKRGGEQRDAAGTAARVAPADDATNVERDGEPEMADTEQAPDQGMPVGPFDASVAPPLDKVLDLGALRIPMVDGVEARVQADSEGRVQQIALVAGDSGLQLAVLAAPRTESIWEEVRAEIRAQLRSDGFASQEAEGPYGAELRTRVRTPDGQTDLRFIGISGPRWLVRAILQGPVALEEQRAPALLDCLRGLVIDRGHEAMPAGEPLPLRLPREMLAERAEGPKTPDAPDAGTADGARAAKPPRRRQNPRRR